MTAEQTPYCKSRSANRAVGRNRNRSIFGTRWHETASAASTERVQRRRQPTAVELEYGEKDARHCAGSALPERGD